MQYRIGETKRIKFWKISDRFNAGFPDILLCIDGEFVAIELKQEKGRVTALQEQEIRDIHIAGGTAEVARSVEEALDIINMALARHKLPQILKGE